ncbi:hypothetical protein LAZ67_1004099 [Cordylochernes scorpioides]|uniref:RNA-directed DNA polymerase n=1 Tax=Cordylochernes scorpioides TaxID=51811 RepID=A0ABY6K0U6_9ARAC|nr:hypothetical protein LAZ67_1004099 [Cordylochernes scorpioides]
MVETRSGKMQDPAQERIQAEESAKPQPGATIGRDASSDPVVLNPNIDIPKYDGTEDPRPWIESLEEIGFLYHWADYIISRYAAMNMTGSAKTWLNLHKASFTSWENIKIRLIQDFSLDANKEELRMKLKRMQHWNEPAIRFAEDILVLCNKVDPAMEEETKIEHVIGGLKKEYSFALYLNPPKTTDDLLVVCKKMDSFEKKYRERLEKSRNLYNGPRYSRPQQQSRYVPPTAARNYQTTSRPQAPVSNNYKNDSPPTPRQYRNNFPQPSTPRRPYNPNFVPKPNLQRNTYNKSQEVSKNRTEDGRPICFKCNKPGHVARYCRVKFIRILEEDPADTQEKVEEKCQMNEISEKSGPRLYADIGTFEALVDTGADLSVVDLRTALDTGHGISKLAKICAGPDGKKLDMVGSIFLNIKIDNETLSHNFVILKTHLRTLILGRDFLKKMNAKIDCKQETIKYDLTNNHDEINFEMLKIKSAKDSIVPECSMKLIKALVETEDGEYIIEESSKMFQTNGLRLARSLINVINRETHIWITNPYPRPLKIMKNQTLAFGSSPAKINVSREREVEKNEEPRFQINENLSPKEQKELKQVLERYGDLFSSRLGRTNLAKHRIDTEDAKPIKHKPYRVSAKERDIIKEQIDEMLTEGIIRPSSSPWSFPVILVKKRDGKYRFCVDYRKLNNVTVKDVYPIPRIDEVMDTLQGSTHFSAIDLRSGYWQVEVEKRDKEKTAFTTAHGLYEFNVMPFGLCNAPATFERNMENMLGNLRWQICLCYLDDVIIYSPDFPTHLKRLEAVFRCFRESNLRLNDKKCRFAFEELEILGYITSKHGIKPAEHNIKAVRNFPRPKKVKEVQSFLGMCSYYRKFIKDFSKIADPLTNLIKKSVSFTWTERQEEAFQTLKTALLSPPILGHFNPNAPTYVHTDASNIGIGATLVQDIGGEEKVISYLSRTLSKAEQNYSTTEKECLAVVWSMSKLRPYLYGRHFKIVTDHHALCWLKNLKDPTGRLARWALKIQEYDFDIIHKSGKKHLDADGLSRGPLPETDWDEDFERLFLNQITDEEDKFSESVKKNLNESRRSIAQNFKEEDGCLFKKNPNPEGRAWLLVVPENKKREIMKEYHNHMSNGHLGVARTMYRIKSKYFWPSMLKDVSEFVKTCHLCQSRKGSNQLPSGLLQPIPPANFPFERIGIDFVGPLPSTKNRKKSIIVLTDYYTRYAETRAVSEATVKEVSKFLVEDIFLRHGAPQYLISDRGSQFTSNLMKEVMKTCKIKHCFTTSYHPQTNGLTERLNRTLINMLSMYVNTDQKNWDEILPFITHAYNTTIQETTGYSPFFLMFGREPTSLLDDRNISVDIDKDDYDEYIKHHLDKINRTRKLVINNTIKTQERMKKNYDKKHMERSYEPGELVAVWTPIRKIGKCEKLLRKYFGPYRILKKLSNVNYLIEPKDNPGQDPLIVHVSRIKPYFERIDEVNHEDGREPILQPLPQRIEMEDDHRPTVSGSYLPCQRQRDPSTFSGDGNINPGQWLKEYERVSKYNRWDETMKLANVVFYLNGTAGRWFDNNEESLNSWRSFEDAFRGVFGLQEDSARRAEEVLKSRAQKAEESSESYIQEILSLCHQVNPRMEEDKFRRELKTPLFKEPGPILKAANKNLIETLGKCVLNIEVNGLNISFEFVVMVECSHDIIFGWDFFKATEAVIDCGRNELHLGETSVLESREEENQRLFASDDFVIPPKSIKKISVINEEICGVRDVLVSTSKDLLLRKEVLIPNSLVTFRHGRGSIWVANGASWPQLIPSGMNMCTMESYENGNICNLIESSDKLQETQLKSREWSQKINLTLDPGLSEIQRLQLVSCLDEFIGIFDFGSTPIKPTSTVKHKINTGDQSPIKQRPYRVAPSERRLIQDEVNKMIENHIVKPSESPWSSPVILVRKKDGTWRFCVDYRRLNKITKKDVYPLPRIDNALDSLAGSSYFSTMDLRSGYWQIEVDEKDREKTAFITPDGLRIKILGHLVDANGIHPDPDKVEAVSKFPRPRNISELKSFLGLCSYYRRFIENFACKARSLHDLLKTEKQFYWDAAQEKAFEVLKTALISEPVLGHFDESADTHLHTDASGHGIGAVLLQIQVWSISKFRPYLFGRPFTVVTDHHSLYWLVGQKDPSGRLARWALKLQEFDVTVIYKSGRKHKDADCLSRSPLENDQPSAVMSLTNVDIEQTKDPDLAKIIDNLNSGYTRKEFSIIDGILYKKNYSTTGRPWLMMIPKHLRSEVMADLHDAPTAGHLGFARTYDKVKKRFYWPGLYRTVRQYVSHCRECQRRKKLPRRPAGQLVSIPPVEKPFYKVGVDLLGRFPVSKDGNRWIIVCTDYMTRYAITKAIPDGGAIETAKFLVEDVILKHGAPREMITDRGRNFISQVIKEINALCGIVHRFTTAYHPQTNGLTERFNKTLGDMLSMYTGVEQKDWDQVLPYVTFAYNTAKQEATGYTPFFLVHAREAETYIDAVLPYLPDEISNDYVGELVTRAEEARQLSRSRLLQSQAKDRRLYDQKHTPVYYQKDDLVWVFTPIRKVGLSEKLLKRYFGPYKVTKKLSEVTYEVEPVDPSPRSRKAKDIVHVIRMKPYLDPEEQHSILLGNTSHSKTIQPITVKIWDIIRCVCLLSFLPPNRGYGPTSKLLAVYYSNLRKKNWLNFWGRIKSLKMTDTSFTFPKLDAFNYNIWKVDMKVLLIDRGSWDFIIEDEPDLPAEATAKDIREFKWRKDRAFTTIYQGVERKYQTLIANAANGKEAWNILKQNFEPNSRARLAGLIDEFYELKFAPDEETIGIFIKRVQEKKQLIKEAGFDLPEVLVCFQLIRKLPQDYDGIIQVLYRLEEKQFNVENIEAHLITESGRVQQKKKDDGLDIVANAYQTKTPRMYQGIKKKNYFSAKAQYSSGSMLEPTVHPRTARTYDIRNCSFCGKTGHLIKDCFLRNKNSQGQHYRKDQNYRGKSSAFHSEILSFHHISERASDPTSEWGEWLIDSAATSHFCKEKDWFVNYQDIPPMDALIGDVDCKSTILEILNSMSKKNTVKGLEKVQGNPTTCDVCKVAKITRSSFKFSYTILTRKPLEKVHMDIWGPAPVRSLGGSRYFLSIIDDYSRKVNVYFLKEKSEVFNYFKQYLHESERALNAKLKCIRRDNGLEFCNKEFENFLVNLGIKIERTSTYSPEQNGIAERFNRTAIEGVRAMLLDSGLQPRFWAEALNTFVYTKNRCEHALTKGVSPMEL